MNPHAWECCGGVPLVEFDPSANGTFLNGRLLTDRISLRIGDEVGCGATLFRLSEHTVASAPQSLDDPNYDTSAESIVVTSPHSLEAARNHLRMVHRLTAATAGTIDTAMILRHLVAILVDEFKPDRCVGVLMDDAKSITQTVQASREELRDDADVYSESIVMHACNDQQGLRIPIVDQDVRFLHDKGVIDSGVKSALCAPLIAHGKGLGAILLEIHSTNRRWTEDELELLSTACGHGGLALLTAILARTRLQHERLAAMGETVKTRGSIYPEGVEIR